MVTLCVNQVEHQKIDVLLIECIWMLVCFSEEYQLLNYKILIDF
jgi:hypothetical protein